MLKKSFIIPFFTVLTFLYFFSPLMSGQSKETVYDVAPGISVSSDTAPSANFTYPKLFGWHYSTIAPQNGGIVGALFFNNQYYLNALNTNLFLYDGGLSGPQNLLNTLTYQGAIRDLTTDGTWLYGAAANTTIHRMDANGISQGTITSAGGNARAIAFSPDENAFFVCDFNNNIGVINATTGALIRTLTGTSALAAKYGMAYTTEAQLTGGPYLWVWGQGLNVDPYNKLWKVNPQTGAVIDTYQFGPLPPGATSPLGIAGGTEVSQIADRWVLLLNYQNFELQGYDLGPAAVVGPGQATDPNPINGSTGVAVSGVNLSWINPSGAATNEVFFGSDINNLTSIHSGSLVSTITAPYMNYITTYYWRVNVSDSTGTTIGPLWNLTTMFSPYGPIFYDSFEGTSSAWIKEHDPGNTPGAGWQIENPPVGAYTFPGTASGGAFAANIDRWGSGSLMPLSTATLASPINFTLIPYNGIYVEWDNDWRALDAEDEAHVEVSINGGTTWNSIWSKVGISVRNTHETVDVFSIVNGQSNVLFRLRVIQPGWDWWWAIDNFTVNVFPIIPVEFSTFTASIINGKINLNWTTVTENNNQGFEIERKYSIDWQKIGFVSGSGTSTETKSYSFTDKDISSGNYQYRLKQLNFDGTFEYSNIIGIELGFPDKFSLSQNYPNPFNPTTRIKYTVPYVETRHQPSQDRGLTVTSTLQITLKVYDILGREITTSVNELKPAGIYEVEFDGSELSSGVYYYKLRAGDFVETRKMVLVK